MEGFTWTFLFVVTGLLAAEKNMRDFSIDEATDWTACLPYHIPRMPSVPYSIADLFVYLFYLFYFIYLFT